MSDSLKKFVGENIKASRAACASNTEVNHVAPSIQDTNILPLNEPAVTPVAPVKSMTLNTGTAAAQSTTAQPQPSLPKQSTQLSSSSEPQPVPSAKMQSSGSSKWWGKGICGTMARGVASSLLIAVILLIVRPQAVLHGGARSKKSETVSEGKQNKIRVNYGSVCLLSTLTGILTVCMFGG